MSKSVAIELRSDRLHLVMAPNGTKSCPVMLYRIESPGVPAVADDVNIVKRDEQLAIIERLPEDLRSEAEALLAKGVERIVRHRTIDEPNEPMGDPLPPELSEDAIAAEFTARHGARFRYTAGWSRWYHYDRTYWRDDATLAVFDFVRDICREKAASCGNAKIASVVASARTVAAAERLARSDRVHAATVEEWDADVWALNTPGGLVDLRTGATQPNRPEHRCTKMTAVAPGKGCRRWMRFLNEITGKDRQLIAFLQRIAGYCLTGSIREHAMFFLYGTGGNGKGVFINTITRILREYAKTAPMETFTASHSDRHPTELAMLRGARMVTAQEVEEGRRWAESKIKSITGGDPIPARFMRADFFEYNPQFKLVIAGNHKPSLRTVDEAIRRRFHLVPFNQTIPKEKRDKDLEEKLCAEWPGILAWMIAGCLAWQKKGLAPPACVASATSDYFEAEDSFQAWMDECCLQHESRQAAVADLFTSWAQWADRRGEKPGTAKAFSQALQARGFERITIGHAKARGFKGLQINPAIEGGHRVA